MDTMIQDSQRSRRSRSGLSFRKYAAVLRVSVASNLAYLMEVFFRALFLIVLMFILTQLWKATFASRGKAVLGGFDVNDIIWYIAVLWLLTQTTGALTPGVRIALQNAQTTILFKLGYDDSKWAVDRFLRPQPEQEEPWGELLFGEAQEKIPDAFASVTSEKDARFLLENQQPGQAIIMSNGTATGITTNIIPPLSVDPGELTRIKDTYCKKLCTKLPLSSSPQSSLISPSFEEETSKSSLVHPLEGDEKPKRAKRRVFE